MIPPRGFKAEQYPLKHHLIYSAGLSAGSGTQNSCYLPIVMSSNDMDVNAETIQTNPHNTAYQEDAGPLVRQMSIIDRLKFTLRFNLTHHCLQGNEIGSAAWAGDGIQHLRLTWRPVFFSFPEKLDAADDDTSTTVATILGLTKDATNEDVVALTTNKLPVAGSSDLLMPKSTVNAVQVFGDFNYTTDFVAEDHPWNETLFQDALRRYTNKGALKACVGRTRFVHLSHARPYQSFHVDKFVPRAIRRVVPYTHMGIQINLPLISDIGQDYHATGVTLSVAHVGIKCVADYHEWNSDHDQGFGDQT